MRALGVALALCVLTSPALAQEEEEPGSDPAAVDEAPESEEAPETDEPDVDEMAPGPTASPERPPTASPEPPPAETSPPPRTEAPSPEPASTRGGEPTPAAGADGADTPAYAQVIIREEEEEEEDEGDPYDFLWIELMGGVSYVDLRAIDQNNYYPTFVKLSGVGPMGGLALGFRIEFLSFGIRGALAHYDDGFDVGTAVAEVTLALPIPIVKPYVRVGFGMGWHGDSDVENSLGGMGVSYPNDVQTTVFGFAFSGAAGLDIYLAHWFSIGAAATVDILNMNRQSTDEPVEGSDDVTDVRFEETGDAVGIQARGQAVITFHL